MSTPLRSTRGAAREVLARDGYAVLAAGEISDAALADPWLMLESIVGERPLLLERQPIRPIPSGRSFASTAVYTPLHTDSQQAFGYAPHLQVMFCRRPAARGGETLLVDGHEVLALVEREDPSLFRALFSVARDIPFYFGAVTTPTVAAHDDALVLTASPMEDVDAVGRAFAAAVARIAPREIAVARGEVLLVDNHRMLHGRRAFEGSERELVRFLAWMRRPLAMATRYLQLAREWRPTPPAPRDEEGMRRLAVVLEMITGVPPAKLAAREGISEAELYRWRARVLSDPAATRASTTRSGAR